MERSEKVEKFLDVMAEVGEINRLDRTRCINCKNPFTNENVFTADGWAEVKISGCCEKCFDVMFAEED